MSFHTGEYKEGTKRGPDIILYGNRTHSRLCDPVYPGKDLIID